MKKTTRGIAFILAVFMAVMPAVTAYAETEGTVQNAAVESAETEETGSGPETAASEADGTSPSDAEPVYVATASEAPKASPSDAAESETEEKAVTGEEEIILTAAAEDGMQITMAAEADAFGYPDGLELCAAVADEEDVIEAEAGLEKKTGNDNIARRVTYDIRVMHDGEETEPLAGKKVRVSFCFAEVPSGADAVSIYHHTDNGEIETVIDEESIGDAKETGDGSLELTGETESFSLYTVDFSYEDKTASLPGGTLGTPLEDILAEIGIEGTISEAKAYQDSACTEEAADGEVKDGGSVLFKVYKEAGVWYVDSFCSFTTEHGLWVKTDGAEYRIRVTDPEQTVFYVSSTGNDSTGNGTLAGPFASVSRAYSAAAGVSSDSVTIALLSDIAMSDATRLIVNTSKTVIITSAAEDGTLIDNEPGDYTGIHKLCRGSASYSMIYMLGGTINARQVIFDGGGSSFTFRQDGSYNGGGGNILNAPRTSVFTMGTNAVMQNNVNTGCKVGGSIGDAWGGAAVLGIDSNTSSEWPRLILESNAEIRDCVAPRHGGAATIYTGDLYLKDNASVHDNGIIYQSSYPSVYFGGNALLIYRRGVLHMQDDVTIKDNRCDLNGVPYSRCAGNAKPSAVQASIQGKIYISGNAQIFDNTVKNVQNAFGLVDNVQANVYDNSDAGGAFIIEGAMGEDAKVGVRSNSMTVAKGTGTYTVTADDAAAFFDDTYVKTVTKKADANQLILTNTIIPVTLGFAMPAGTAASGTLSQAITGLSAGDFSVFVNGTKWQQGTADGTYSVSVNGTSVSIEPHGADFVTDTVTVSISKNGYKVTDAAGSSVVTVPKKPALSLTIDTYTGAYDGKAHRAAITPSLSGVKLTYSVDGGTTWTETVPEIINVGKLTAKVKAEKTDYPAYTAEYVLTVTPGSEKTVRFEMNGHGTAVPSQNVCAGLAAVRPADPSAEHYVFEGWFGDEDLTELFDFSSPVTEETVVYAKWTPYAETITYDLRGGRWCPSGANPDTYTIESEDIVLRSPEKENSVFIGWKEKESDLPNPIVMIKTGSTGSRKFEAVWAEGKQQEFAGKSLGTAEKLITPKTGLQEEKAMELAFSAANTTDFSACHVKKTKLEEIIDGCPGAKTLTFGISVELTEVLEEAAEGENTVTYEAFPYIQVIDTDGTVHEKIKAANPELNSGSVTLNLAVPADSEAVWAVITHTGEDGSEEKLGSMVHTGENGQKYVSVSVRKFSTFAIALFDTCPAEETVYGEWIRLDEGWRYYLENGTYAKDGWYELDNSYATGLQEKRSWFHFDGKGFMQTGWFTDTDGKVYYLNPVSDGTLGRMFFGKQIIDGTVYDFSEDHDGFFGHMTEG